MKNRKYVKPFCFILIIYSLLSSIGLGVYAEEIAEESNSCPKMAEELSEESLPTLSDNVQVGSRFWELLFGKDGEKKSDISLIPGGQVFGVKIKQKYVTVTDAKGIPALKSGDIILSIDGKQVSSASEVKRIVERSSGESLTIRALHQGSEIGVEIRPTYEDGEYRIGLTLRDGAAGLGTVTFVDPKTGFFGGLGHGICDSDSGEVILMETGEVCGVILGGIHKGECGKPGELCGILTDRDLGDLTVNCECGVFGVITDPSSIGGKALNIGNRSDVTEGEATIISTLKNGKTAEYKIEIYDIDRDSTGSKSFRVRVTDETLKALTGGIVRGMSGSPIIQNGKLIGAVTHVMVANPTEGYGIFIENMLNAANFTELKKAA